MNARRGAERVFADHGIVRRNRNAGRSRNSLTVALELGQVLTIPRRDSHELQVDQHLIHLRVADALSDAERGRVHAIRACRERRHGVRDCQSPVAVAVPVNANFFARRPDHFFEHEFHQRGGAQGRGVSGGVTDHQSARATLDGCGVELLHRLRIAAGGVFGDVHDLQAERDRVSDGLFGGLKKEVSVPSLGVAADRA